MAERKRLIIGVSGASGSSLAYHLMQTLSKNNLVETYLIMTNSAKRTWELEKQQPLHAMIDLADHVIDNHDIAACCASGSFPIDGMIIVPCSMKTIAGICCGYSDTLLLRAADVAIKEKRKLVLCFRENPLSTIHFHNLASLSSIQNVYLMPMMMTYYHQPQSIEDMEASLIGKMLDVFDITYEKYQRWMYETI